MPYSIFLLIFLVMPILLLAWLLRGQLNRRHLLWIGTLMSVALLYTTPWDNYLVASRVWWYDPQLVLGVTIGWVPIEEYAFFLLQPLMVSLWVLFLSRFIPVSAQAVSSVALRLAGTGALGLIWLASLIILITGWQPGNYLALILIWALPAVALQTGFGADILWRQWRLVAGGLLPALAYLSIADALAIRSGTWTINPARSLEMYMGGVLPIEEFVFFLMTNVLIVFSIVLLLAPQSHARMQRLLGLLPNARSSADNAGYQNAGQ